MKSDIILIFQKEDEYYLTENLSTREVRCQCGYKDCVTNVFSASTAKSFQELRNAFGKPITVTSGYRCQRHNYISGGVNRSFHKLGQAIDLFVESREDLRQLRNKAKLYFDVVLSYPTFIHCHNEGEPEEIDG